MNNKNKSIIAIIAAGIWINFSEFLRNEILLKSFWLKHYEGMDLTFPSEPVNGIVWVVWGFMFAISIFFISQKFSFKDTVLLGWFVGFFLMWLVAWNLNVLPLNILYYALPLSLLEVLIAVYLIKKISPQN